MLWSRMFFLGNSRICPCHHESFNHRLITVSPITSVCTAIVALLNLSIRTPHLPSSNTISVQILIDGRCCYVRVWGPLSGTWCMEFLEYHAEAVFKNSIVRRSNSSRMFPAQRAGAEYNTIPHSYSSKSLRARNYHGRNFVTESQDDGP